MHIMFTKRRDYITIALLVLYIVSYSFDWFKKVSGFELFEIDQSYYAWPVIAFVLAAISLVALVFKIKWAFTINLNIFLFFLILFITMVSYNMLRHMEPGFVIGSALVLLFTASSVVHVIRNKKIKELDKEALRALRQKRMAKIKSFFVFISKRPFILAIASLVVGFQILFFEGWRIHHLPVFEISFFVFPIIYSLKHHKKLFYLLLVIPAVYIIMFITGYFSYSSSSILREIQNGIYLGRYFLWPYYLVLIGAIYMAFAEKIPSLKVPEQVTKQGVQKIIFYGVIAFYIIPTTIAVMGYTSKLEFVGDSDMEDIFELLPEQADDMYLLFDNNGYMQIKIEEPTYNQTGDYGSFNYEHIIRIKSNEDWFDFVLKGYGNVDDYELNFPITYSAYSQSIVINKVTEDTLYGDFVERDMTQPFIGINRTIFDNIMARLQSEYEDESSRQYESNDYINEDMVGNESFDDYSEEMNVESAEAAYVSYSVKASSTMPPYNDITYEAVNCTDSDLNTWWSPNTKDVKNCWFRMDFSSEAKVSGLKIHAGAHYPHYIDTNGKSLGDLYPQNLRIKKARLEFSDGANVYLDFEDMDRIQQLSFSAKNTEWIVIRPLEFYPSSKWEDLCISHIEPVF